MNIKDVLKEENINEEFEFNYGNVTGKIKIVKEYGFLIAKYKNKPIESIFNLDSIINQMDFRSLDDNISLNKYGDIDWNNVKVDRAILVSNDNENWNKRYFAFYRGDKIFAWINGYNSHTSKNDDCCYGWKYAQLLD